MSMFPWDNLHGDTIRIVIRDLGLSEYTVRTRRAELIRLLRDVETDGAVVQRLQESAARVQSPEIEYAGSSFPTPAREPAHRYPVVEIPMRPGPSRLPPHRRVSSSETDTGAFTSASVSSSTGRDSGGPSRPAKKPRIQPPSYAVLHQLEQEMRRSSATPVPVVRPHRIFDGVHVPLLPTCRTQAVGTSVDEDVDEDGEGVPQSVSVSRAPAASGGVKPAEGPSFARRFEAVEVSVPAVEAVMSQWKQSASSRRRNED
ncbi:hypothetical protein C8Q79DRAFT_292693 [Trametes meyenii]|nr:hypothetical protein C8Q79DRAFT_292693 [Trametes meyenii]